MNTNLLVAVSPARYVWGSARHGHSLISTGQKLRRQAEIELRQQVGGRILYCTVLYCTVLYCRRQDTGILETDKGTCKL